MFSCKDCIINSLSLAEIFFQPCFCQVFCTYPSFVQVFFKSSWSLLQDFCTSSLSLICYLHRSAAAFLLIQNRSAIMISTTCLQTTRKICSQLGRRRLQRKARDLTKHISPTKTKTLLTSVHSGLYASSSSLHSFPCFSLFHDNTLCFPAPTYPTKTLNIFFVKLVSSHSSIHKL